MFQQDLKMMTGNKKTELLNNSIRLTYTLSIKKHLYELMEDSGFGSDLRRHNISLFRGKSGFFMQAQIELRFNEIRSISEEFTMLEVKVRDQKEEFKIIFEKEIKEELFKSF